MNNQSDDVKSRYRDMRRRLPPKQTVQEVLAAREAQRLAEQQREQEAAQFALQKKQSEAVEQVEPINLEETSSQPSEQSEAEQTNLQSQTQQPKQSKKEGKPKAEKGKKVKKGKKDKEVEGDTPNASNDNVSTQAAASRTLPGVSELDREMEDIDEGLFGRGGKGKVNTPQEIFVPSDESKEQEEHTDDYILFEAKTPAKANAAKLRISKLLDMTYEETPNVELDELTEVDQPLEELIKEVLDDDLK